MLLSQGMAFPIESFDESSPQRRAQQAGAQFEARLSIAHDVYWAEHKALVYHNGVHARFIPHKGWVPDRAATRPDYSGVVAPWGLAIHFDAKTTDDKDGWALDRRMEHQYRDLVAMARLGAVCFFLIECRPRARYYALHVSGLVPMQGALALPSLKFAHVPRAYAQRKPQDRPYATLIDQLDAIAKYAKGTPGAPRPSRHKRIVIGSALWLTATGGIVDYLPHVLAAWDRLPHQPLMPPLHVETGGS